MVLSVTEQRPGTDFCDSHNKTNLDRIDAAIAQTDKLPEDKGHIAQAALLIATLPTDTNTVTIGSDVYEFEGAGSNINVLKGANAAASRANLVIAINTEGTELVVADQPTVPANSVRIRPADRVGGTAQIGAGPSIAVSETLTDAADIWNAANLNETGASPYKKVARGTIVANSTNLLATIALEMEFTPVVLHWAAFDTNGAPKVTDCQCAISGDFLTFDFDVGSTDLSATDYVTWVAFGN